MDKDLHPSLTPPFRLPKMRPVHMFTYPTHSRGMNIWAEILAVGDELLRGDVLNTNATWLATRLKEIGLPLRQVTEVGDSLEPLVQTLREATTRCDVLVITGGLGPTDDDRTREAVARAAGQELVLCTDALSTIRQRFAGHSLTPNNEKQAWMPKDAEVLPNDRGTAPGFMLLAGTCRLFCLPGVPVEMRWMFDTHVAPRLRGVATPALIRSLKVFGLAESQIVHRLADLLRELPEGRCSATVHYRTSFPENEVILVVRPTSDAESGEAAALLGRLEAEARNRLGRHVFSADGASFSEVVVDDLRKVGATLALAESCTGGLVGDLLTAAPGSSDVFGLGVIAYGDKFKRRVLGVPEEILLRYGAVSRECVEAMARGVRELADATLGLAVSGIAGPDGGTEEKPVGTVHIALASAEGVRHLLRRFPFERQRVKLLSAYVALSLVRHHLAGEWNVGTDPLEGRWSYPSRR
jgi:nicotinamide-nucleotide amidase